MEGSVSSGSSRHLLRTHSVPVHHKTHRTYGDHGSRSDDGAERRHLRSHRGRETETDSDQWSRANEQVLNRRKHTRTVSSQPGKAWGDTSTVVTSDGEESACDVVQLDASFEENYESKFSRYAGPVFAGFFAMLAFLSPILMVILPLCNIGGWTADPCSTACESSLLSMSFKLLILLIGSWAVFLRRPRSSLPRIFVLRAIVVFLIFLVCFVFWLFYGMHIIRQRVNDYDSITSYAVSLVDVLLFVHYVAVIMIEVRHLQPQYVVKIVRSPDGETHSYSVGQLSVQRLAVWCLEQYYRDFQVYNPYLNSISRRRPSTTKFKVYNIDGNAADVVGDSQNAVTIGGSRDSEHNRRFYDEQYYGMKVSRRKARLVTAVEDAFVQVQRLSGQDSNVAIEAQQVAQAIFPVFGKALQKYLNVTRQRPRYTRQDVLEHLTLCITFDIGPKAFLSRYLTQGPVIWNDKEHNETQMWTIRSEVSLNGSAQDGTVFHLHQRDVSLLVSLRKFPHFNLTEKHDMSRSARFVLKMNSETPL